MAVRTGWHRYGTRLLPVTLCIKRVPTRNSRLILWKTCRPATLLPVNHSNCGFGQVGNFATLAGVIPSPFPAATTSIVKTLGTTAWHQSSVAHLYRSPVRAVTGSLAAATGQRIARCSSAARRYRDMFRTSFIDRLSRFVERTAGRCGAHRANVSFSL